jgi:hypothetical protein
MIFIEPEISVQFPPVHKGDAMADTGFEVFFFFSLLAENFFPLIFGEGLQGVVSQQEDAVSLKHASPGDDIFNRRGGAVPEAEIHPDVTHLMALPAE